MNAEERFLGEVAQFELEAELALWDWARTAGVSADELREALRAALAGPAPRTDA